MHGRGACKLTASLVRGRTALTHVQHAAPARLLPLENAALSEALAAGCALSSYGGGHVGGDSLEYDIAVEQDATLFVCTQSSAKVYRARGDGLRSSVSTRLEVADGGLAVMAPDPVVPFRNSRFVSTTEVVLQGRGASVVAVEAMGCGRLDGGERWCFDSVEQRLTLTYGSAAASLPTTPIAPVLTDATTLLPARDGGGTEAFDMGGIEYNAYASVLAAGPRAAAVMERIEAVCRGGEGSAQSNQAHHQQGPAAVLWGCSTVPLADGSGGSGGDGSGACLLARVVAVDVESLYVALWQCLEPATRDIGVRAYDDRLHFVVPESGEVRGAIIGSGPANAQKPSTEAASGHHNEGEQQQEGHGGGGLPRSGKEKERVKVEKEEDTEVLNMQQQWRMMQLADATLPVGGFAHSGGLEAAAQGGLVVDEGSLASFVRQSMRQNARLLDPFVAAAHAAIELERNEAREGEEDADVRCLARWRALDDEMHSLMVSNHVACRASLQQGAGLVRVLGHWLDDSGTWPPDSGGQDAIILALQAAMQAELTGHTSTRGHLATSFGVVGQLLGLSRTAVLQCFAYTSARDLLSAAVRLNVVGPLAATRLLDAAAQDAARFAKLVPQDVANAATCNPLLEAVHMRHDLLFSRLFQT